MRRMFYSVCMLLILTSCSLSGTGMYPQQTWKDLTIHVETRPAPLIKGTNEFLVYATINARQPGSDLIVSIKERGSKKWHQAIQDGHVGVYRRAILIQNPKTNVLQVRIKRDKEVGLLEFALNDYVTID
ncbi:MAG: hypothetical protein GXP14_07265 [Gammaproteobacteria bacterium]|nr:hypothetical protein [Gammaproteobacteria bacterium]